MARAAVKLTAMDTRKPNSDDLVGFATVIEGLDLLKRSVLKICEARGKARMLGELTSDDISDGAGRSVACLVPWYLSKILKLLEAER